MSVRTSLAPLRLGSAVAARWLAVALGLAIPLSVAADGVLVGAFVLAWLASGDFDGKWRAARASPAALAALLLFALLALGTVYGPASPAAAAAQLSKYQDLLLVPMLVSVFGEPRFRRYAVWAFLAGMLVTLALSYLIGLGLFPDGIFRGTREDPTVFRLHVTQNFFMAYAAFALACLARDETSKARRGVLYGLAFLALFNAVFMVQGRTGYLVAGLLLVFFLFERAGWKSLATGVLALALLGGAGFFGSTSFRDAVNRGLTEYSQWRPDQPADTSVGWRLEFYTNTLRMIQERPLTGVGTGGFSLAYGERVKGTGRVDPGHPHSEYLLMAAQLGVVGLAAFVGMLVTHWRVARRVSPPLDRSLATGLVLAMALGCLFNTLLLDHSEGLFYCWLIGVLGAGMAPRAAPA
ncbi:MAG: O-antigen ligase family protein [Burkholderiales bacterium]